MKKCKLEGKRLPSRTELLHLAKYLYGTEDITATGKIEGLTLNEDKLRAVSSALFTNFKSRSNNWFYLWSGAEGSKFSSSNRNFYHATTNYNYGYRHPSAILGVCVP